MKKDAPPPQLGKSTIKINEFNVLIDFIGFVLCCPLGNNSFISFILIKLSE